MQPEYVIEVNHVSKIFSKNYKSAQVELFNILRESFGGCRAKNTLRKDEFWALRDLSFSVRKGERLAIIGPNGSGKSTLLKMLSGIYLPDNGTIRITGGISSILELSSGFKSELSGLENIYLKFALLGKRREEVDRIIDEVIEFSELKEFMETPLKHYSSGMKSKLGFSIVSHMDAEILILDEVFAVGDKKFRAKSEARIKSLYQNTTTILVSHNMKTVEKLADRVIVLVKGEKKFDGDTKGGIEFYNTIMK